MIYLASISNKWCFMKLKKSVHYRLFFCSVSLFITNIIIFFLWVLKIKQYDIRLYISAFFGAVFGFILDKELNCIAYDELDNDNIKFLFLLIVSVIALVLQIIFLN